MGHGDGVFVPLVKMTCYIADFEGKIKASSEIQEIRWLDTSDLEKISQVDKLIFKDLHQKEIIK